MISHYTIYSEPSILGNLWSIKMDSEYRPTYNAQPTQKLPVITNHTPDQISFFHWGVIPGMARKKSVSPKLLGIGLDELKAKQILQSNLVKARCIIPMQGVYWERPIGKRKSTPMYTFLNNHEPVAVAGLWSQFDDFDGNVHFTFKIITQRSSEEFEEFGNELPLIVDKATVNKWLSGDSSYDDLLSGLSVADKNGLGTYAVTPRVLDPNADDKLLIQTS
ncbi:MAG: SOS response-associated peptidase family protein, partial [Bacteroidota bacterium]